MRLDSAQLQRALDHLEHGDWQAAHEIVQQDEDSPLACWAHGIVHLMEGDLPNARYWYGQAKRTFPAKPNASAEIHALAAQVSGKR
jgi:Tfp pilus assembly protein PilF